MISLKSYSGPLSSVLGLTPDALYERQRALTRAGYFSGAIAGKGPGSGIRATSTNVVKLLLSILSTESLSDVVAKSRRLAAAKHIDGKCPLTGETRFQRALEKVLTTESLMELTRAIEVQRGGLSASARIIFSKGQTAFSDFGKLLVPTEFEVIARLNRMGILFISTDLEDIAAGKPLSELSVHKPFKGFPTED